MAEKNVNRTNLGLLFTLWYLEGLLLVAALSVDFPLSPLSESLCASTS